MSVFCPNCGSENESGNKFCRKCGTALGGLAESPSEAAAAPLSRPPEESPAESAAPPAAAAAPPVGAASGDQAGNVAAAYAAPTPPPPGIPVPPAAVAPPAPAAAPPPPPATPAGGRRPPTRLSTPVLVGGLAAVLGVGAAIGIVFAGGHEDPPPDPSPVATAAASIAPSTQGPTVTLQPPPTQGPGATLVAPTPTPNAPVPTPGPGDSKIILSATVSIIVPADWKGGAKDNGINVFPPTGGQLALWSEALKEPATASEILAGDLNWYEENVPDAKVCAEEKDFQVPNGPMGRRVLICYTAKTQSGESYPAIDFIVAGTDDNAYYWLLVVMPKEGAEQVLDVIVPTMTNIRWLLREGG